MTIHVLSIHDKAIHDETKVTDIEKKHKNNCISSNVD